MPGAHLVDAALRVAASLSGEPQPLGTFRMALAHTPTDGLYTLEQLYTAEEILVRAGFASRDAETILLLEPVPDDADLLAARYLERAPPAWLGAATAQGTVDTQLVPDDDLEALSRLFGPDRRDELLLALGRTFDDAYRSALGQQGEEAVVEACRTLLREAGASHLATAVCHVSRISDQLGYDVRTPTTSGGVLRLEVKTDTVVSTAAHIYLSRAEWETARREPAWRLVVCKREEGGDVRVHAWTRAEALAPYLPSDAAEGRWQSAELFIRDSDLTLGLPEVADGSSGA